ncbi:MAG: helix-turn-helix transcriptional regulator [Oscillospiraceae bacterium]|nr:helix-turn-helix transcriptional regulator [Oscillospiraceae bacterium]
MSEKFTIPRLKELRGEHGFYQRQVAEYLGCTQQTYSRYEISELQLPLPLLIKLTYFYDVSTDFILGLTDIRKRPAPPEES